MENPEWISKVERLRNARYVGLYDLPNREGPFHVFWQAEPDVSQGHDNYFGMFWRTDPDGQPIPYITSAASIREARYPAIIDDEGVFICSRYRHDYQTRDGAMIDGGLAYTRYHLAFPPNGHIEVRDGKEVFVHHD